jgi:hypothetical protein
MQTNFVKKILASDPSKLDFFDLSCDPRIGDEIVEKFINESWDYGTDFKIESHSLDMYMDKKRLGLSGNYGISFSFVAKHLDKPWNKDILATRHDMTAEDLKLPFDWDMAIIQEYGNTDVIRSIPEEQLRYDLLSSNNNMKIGFVLEHKDAPWDWTYEGLTSTIHDHYKMMYPDLPWQWSHVHTSMSSLSMLEKFTDKPWDFKQFILESQNHRELFAKLINIIKRHPDKDWGWHDLFDVRFGERHRDNAVSIFRLAQTFPDKNWNWEQFQHVVRKLPNEFHWQFVDFIIEHLDKKWSFNAIYNYLSEEMVHTIEAKRQRNGAKMVNIVKSIYKNAPFPIEICDIIMDFM